MKQTVVIFLTLLLLSSCGDGRKQFHEPRSEADLSGLTIATSNGTYYHGKFEKRTDVGLYIANTETDALQAVRQGLADVYVTDEIILSQEEMERLNIKLAFRGKETFKVAFALKQGNRRLQTELNRFLSEAPIEDIISHWIAGTPEVPEKEYQIAPDAPPLRCVCAINMAPVSYISAGGEWKGMEPDILRRFAHTTGRRFQMENMSLAAAVAALQAGNCDIVSACITPTEERQLSVDFSDPYYEVHPGYFVPNTGGRAHAKINERLRRSLLIERRWEMILHGLLETVKITLFSILLGSVLGGFVCAAKRSRRRWLRELVALYGLFISGIPALVFLLILFYVVFAGTGMPPSAVAIVTFALCFASSSGNIFHSAISSVPRGQIEAGLSLGFTPMQTFNFVILPQALKKGLPFFAGECVGLLKSTSIVGYIAIHDLTHVGDLIRSRTFDAFMPLFVVTLIYFLLAWLIRKGLGMLLPEARRRKNIERTTA